MNTWLILHLDMHGSAACNVVVVDPEEIDMTKLMTACVVTAIALSSGFGGLAGCAGGTVEPVESTGETSQALSGKELDYEYYSDATYTVLVGTYYQSCTGIGSLSGTRTKYVIGTQTTCSNNVTIGCYEYINSQLVCGYASCANCF